MDRPPPSRSFLPFHRPRRVATPEERGRRRRIAAALAGYVVVTTLAFSPRLPARARRLGVGTIAREDLVSPRDAILPDNESTQAKRRENRDQVLSVYDEDTQAASRLEEELRRLFRSGRAGLAPRGEGRGRRAPDPTRKGSGDDSARGALSRARYSADLENRLVAIESRLYRTGVVDNKELLLQNREQGVVVRQFPAGTEKRTHDVFAPIEYGSDARSAVVAELASTGLPAADRREIAAFLVGALRPNLSLNAAETARRREEASRRVESVFVKIPQGATIVRAGDVVTPRAAEIYSQVAGAPAGADIAWRMTGLAAFQILAAALFALDAQLRRRSNRSAWTLLPLLVIGTVFSLVVRLGFFLAHGLGSSFPSHVLSAGAFAVPFAAGPIIALLVCGVGPAVLFAAVQAFDVGILFGMSFPFAAFALAGALAGAYGLKRLRSRSVLVVLAGIVACANVAVAAILGALEGRLLAGSLGVEMASAAAGGLVVVGCVAFLLPIFEGVFHVTTDIRLLELSNQNLPLLRTLAFEAPGTYQHSLMLGHLAEAAAEAIGADPLLARVCGYYHDIGKTKMPEYFIENQPRGSNRHDRLEPSMSALIIASHVKEGVEMARRNRLPEPIVTGIREHHGTKLIRYFYQKALTRARPESPPVPETDYRYPGPRPSNRVTGILMIADAVEAASRTILEPTPARIAAMVKAISSDCLRDGQFDECDLTLQDIATIDESLIRTVTTIYHHRIDYPGFDFNAGKPEKRRRTTGGLRLTAK
jgi:putative nucleotidyltransferase with HDIG domain